VIKILKRIIDDKPRQWHTILIYTIWSYRTTTKSSTGHTPFKLLYGQEVIILVDLEINSLRLALQVEELNSSNISQRIDALLALEEQIKHALENLRKRKQTIKKYFDKNSISAIFKVNDKVLLWDVSHVEKGKHSKFQKLWLGPYKITSIVGNNSYFLKDMEERFFSFTTNGSNMKHYVYSN